MPEDRRRPVTDHRFRAQDKTEDERSFCATRCGVTLRFSPRENYPQVDMRLTSDQGAVEGILYTSHLAFAKLFTEYDFISVLDIGSGSGIFAKSFGFLGKEVTTIDVIREYSADFGGDYVTLPRNRQYDLVWCSHILEHQRNVGAFLDRLFDDLREGGIAAVSVPSALSPMIIGHPNIFTPMHLIYNLVLAGFDCRNARVKIYDWNLTVIVEKKPNGIARSNIATTHYPLDAPNYHPRLLDFFPVEIADHGHCWGEVDSINW